MNISVLTLFPELYKPFFESSLLKKAQEKGILDVNVKSLFSFVAPKERIDSPTIGHGAGMLIKPEVVEKAVLEQESLFGKAYKVFFSPQGKKLDQHMVKELSEKMKQHQHVLFFASRYEGVDARVETVYADEIISIGDYVLMGGDLPAMVLLEATLRFLPGVVGKQESVEKDSYTGPYVDFPAYTHPVIWHDQEVPAVLRSGNHGLVDEWRLDAAIKATLLKNFAWLRSYPLSEKQIQEVKERMPRHYAVLMHADVLVEGKSGCSSVTSLDIHDIARSGATYGIENYFIVTPLEDQQKIVKTLLSFWQTDIGIAYNPHRHEALRRVVLVSTFDEVCDFIEKKEGKRPIVVSTSARREKHERIITYHDQGKIWSLDSPVLFVFGTAQGLTPAFVDKCDYLLGPLYGFSTFNHLSVRSAAAVIFDRWFGLNRKF